MQFALSHSQDAQQGDYAALKPSQDGKTEDVSSSSEALSVGTLWSAPRIMSVLLLVVSLALATLSLERVSVYNNLHTKVQSECYGRYESASSRLSDMKVAPSSQFVAVCIVRRNQSTIAFTTYTKL